MLRELIQKIASAKTRKIEQPVVTYTHECRKGFLGFFKKSTLAFTVMTEPDSAPAASVEDIVSVTINNFNEDGSDKDFAVFVTYAKHNSADAKAPGRTDIRGVIVE